MLKNRKKIDSQWELKSDTILFLCKIGFPTKCILFKQCLDKDTKEIFFHCKSNG